MRTVKIKFQVLFKLNIIINHNIKLIVASDENKNQKFLASSQLE